MPRIQTYVSDDEYRRLEELATTNGHSLYMEARLALLSRIGLVTSEVKPNVGRGTHDGDNAAAGREDRARSGESSKPREKPHGDEEFNKRIAEIRRKLEGEAGAPGS